jgi:hypothetical protein
MVEPVTDDERFSFLTKLKVGFVALVGLSAGLITLQAGADPLLFVGATGVGGLVGVLLVAVAFPDGIAVGDDDGTDRTDRERYRR